MNPSNPPPFLQGLQSFNVHFECGGSRAKIVTQPISQSVPVGTNVTLSVVAEGTEPFWYQWKFNGANVTGATKSVLTITNAQPENSGDYTVVVRNYINSVTSSIATLTVGGSVGYSLTVNITGMGTVERNPSQNWFVSNSIVMLTAIPASNSAFVSWSGDASGKANPLNITMDSRKVVTATFVNKAIAIFVDDEFVITNEVSRFRHAEIAMQTTFENGTIVFTLDGTAPTAASHLYEGPFTISASATIRALAYDATFTTSWEADRIQINILPAFALSAITAGGGSINTSPTNRLFQSNTVVTVTATPRAGWSFLQWLGDAEGTNSTVTLLMDRDRCLESVFGTALRTTASGGGSIAVDAPAPLYPYGWPVSLTAIPSVGHSFAIWGDAGRGTNNPLLVTVTNANANVSALFTDLVSGEYSPAVRTVGLGHVSITPRANRYTSGQVVTLSAMPEVNQEFLGWIDHENEGTSTQNPLSVAMNRHTFITATFTRRPSLAVWDCGNRLPTDPLRVIISGELGDRFAIESSPDLLSWSPEHDATNEFGRTQFNLPLTNPANQFIRVRLKQ